MGLWIDIPENLRDDAITALGGIGNRSSAKFSYKSYEGKKSDKIPLAIFPKHIGNVLRQKPFNLVLNSLSDIPEIQIRSYFQRTLLTEFCSMFSWLEEGFHDASRAYEKGELFTQTAEMLKKYVINTQETIKDLMSSEFSMTNIANEIVRTIAKSNSGYFKNITNQMAHADSLIRLPYYMTIALLGTVGNGYYEFPYTNQDELLNSNSDYGFSNSTNFSIGGWASSNEKQSILKFLTRTMGVRITPFFNPNIQGESQSPKITVTLDLFNDCIENVKNNFKFIQTFVANNMWVQNGLVQGPGSLYDVQIPGIQRYFMCTCQVSVKQKGILRRVPAKAFSNEKHFDKDNIIIPDVYSVTLTFTPLISNNFNNFIYNVYLANGDEIHSTKNIVEEFKDGLSNALKSLRDNRIIKENEKKSEAYQNVVLDQTVGPRSNIETQINAAIFGNSANTLNENSPANKIITTYNLNLLNDNDRNQFNLHIQIIKDNIYKKLKEISENDIDNNTVENLTIEEINKVTTNSINNTFFPQNLQQLNSSHQNNDDIPTNLPSGQSIITKLSFKKNVSRDIEENENQNLSSDSQIEFSKEILDIYTTSLKTLTQYDDNKDNGGHELTPPLTDIRSSKNFILSNPIKTKKYEDFTKMSKNEMYESFSYSEICEYSYETSSSTDVPEILDIENFDEETISKWIGNDYVLENNKIYPLKQIADLQDYFISIYKLKNKENSYVIVANGTNDASDWKSICSAEGFKNLNLMAKFNYMKAILQLLTENSPENVEFHLCGHGVGGTIVQFGSISIDSNKIKNCHSYNSLGFDNLWLTDVDFSNLEIMLNKITNIRLQGDAISSMGLQLGNKYQIRYSKECQFNDSIYSEKSIIVNNNCYPNLNYQMVKFIPYDINEIQEEI